MVQVGIEPEKIVFNIRVFEHIVAGKRFKGRHPEKLEIEMHRPEQIVHTVPAKKILAGIVERMLRCIERHGQHILLAGQGAARIYELLDK